MNMWARFGIAAIIVASVVSVMGSISFGGASPEDAAVDVEFVDCSRESGELVCDQPLSVNAERRVVSALDALEAVNDVSRADLSITATGDVGEVSLRMPETANTDAVISDAAGALADVGQQRAADCLGGRCGRTSVNVGGLRVVKWVIA